MVTRKIAIEGNPLYHPSSREVQRVFQKKFMSTSVCLHVTYIRSHSCSERARALAVSLNCRYFCTVRFYVRIQPNDGYQMLEPESMIICYSTIHKIRVHSPFCCRPCQSSTEIAFFFFLLLSYYFICCERISYVCGNIMRIFLLLLLLFARPFSIEPVPVAHSALISALVCLFILVSRSH